MEVKGIIGTRDYGVILWVEVLTIDCMTGAALCHDVCLVEGIMQERALYSCIKKLRSGSQTMLKSGPGGIEFVYWGHNTTLHRCHHNMLATWSHHHIMFGSEMLFPMLGARKGTIWAHQWCHSA